MLKELLQKLGLTEKEILIYTVILQHGRLSYTDTSKKTALNRTTVYSVTKELLHRGILQEDLASPVKSLVAAPPESLSALFVQEEEKLNEKKKLLEQAIEEVRSQSSVVNYVAPAITFIPEHRISQYMRERNEAWNAGLLSSDKTWWGFQDVSFVKKYGEWITWYWNHAPTDISLKLFSNDEQVEREMQKRTPSRREIRYWTGDQTFTGTLWIIGDTVITINAHEHPFSLIEMRDKVTAQNLRTVFSTIWNSKT